MKRLFLSLTMGLLFTSNLFGYVPGEYERIMGGKQKVLQQWERFKESISTYDHYTTRYAEYSAPILKASAYFILEMEYRFEKKNANPRDIDNLAGAFMGVVDRLGVSRTLIPQLINLMEIALNLGRYDLLATLSPAMTYLNPVLSFSLEEIMQLPSDYSMFTSSREVFKKRYGYHSSEEASASKGKSAERSQVAPSSGAGARPKELDLPLVCISTRSAFNCAGGIKEDRLTTLMVQKERIIKDALFTLSKTAYFGPSSIVSDREFQAAFRGAAPDLKEVVQSTEAIVEFAKANQRDMRVLQGQISQMEKELSEMKKAAMAKTREKYKLSDKQVKHLFNFLKLNLKGAEAALEVAKIRETGVTGEIKRYYQEINRSILKSPDSNKVLKELEEIGLPETEDALKAMKVAMAVFKSMPQTDEKIPEMFAMFGEMMISEMGANGANGLPLPRELQGIIGTVRDGASAGDIERFINVAGKKVLSLLESLAQGIPFGGNAACFVIEKGGTTLLQTCSPMISKAIVSNFDIDGDNRVEISEVGKTIRKDITEAVKSIKEIFSPKS